MAKKTLIDSIIKLYSKLGGNVGEVLGTRSNISFLGTGKSPEGFIDSTINIDAIGALGKNKVLDELKSSIGYLTANKLNDVQAGKLYENMLKIDNVFNPPAAPANIVDLGTGTRNLTDEGLGALRATRKTDDDVRIIKDEALKKFPEETHQFMGRPLKDADFVKIDQLVKEGKIPAAGSGSEAALPPKTLLNDVQEMQKRMVTSENAPKTIAERISSDVNAMKRTGSNEIDALETMTKNKAGAEFITGYVDDIYKNSGATASVDVPKKRAAAREFLYNILKKETDLLPPGKGGTLESVISEADYKYVMEGGGGALGDPLIIVKKYFGDEIAKRIPLDTRTEVIDTFVENVRFTKDRAGFATDDPRFNPDDIPDFAEGGRAGFKFGGLGRFTKAEVLIQRLLNTIKESKDKTDELSVYVNKTFPGFVEEIKANPKLAENEQVWKTLGIEGLPKDQRLVVHSDDTVNFFRQHEGPGNIDRITTFMEKHPFLSREDALRIMKMEPEDQVLEITRLEVLNKRTKNAHGGLAQILEV